MDEEKVQNFSDMVNATEKLTSPWRKALALTNILWAIVLALFIWFAYMTPVDMGQNQDFTQQIQSQNYSERVTNGK